MDEPVRVGVDVGGTFTDVVLVADGDVVTEKVPTTEIESAGVVEGIRAALAGTPHDPADVDSFRHATTVAVNALLENTVADAALVTTAGFADVLEIGRQARPELYGPEARRPSPLIPADRRYEVDERATTEGIERQIDEAEVRALATEIEADAVAISFLHAYAHPENERRAVELLREALDVPVVASHEVLPAFREYERTATTVADAALAPVVGDYLDGLADRVDDAGLPAPRIMQANGGITEADVVRDAPVSTVLSGPAAGVVGASVLAERPDSAGGDDDTSNGVVTLDMGGTSTDVALVEAGDVERTTEADIGGHPVRIPMVDMTTVGAGGGSIARVDAGGALRVGPESAGAEPGPACYGRGGTEPTVTDACLQLGYLGAGTTLGEDLQLDPERATAALERLASDADLAGPTAAAAGIVRVATATTTRAIRRVTVERGHDPREMTLAAFGGAGPMLATHFAEQLDIEHLVVPPTSGVLSAFGLLAADESQDAVRTVRRPLSDAMAGTVEPIYSELIARARGRLSDPEAVTIARRADLRYAGQSHELTVSVPDEWDRETVEARFHAAHEREHGYRLPDDPIELVTLGVEATIAGDPPTIVHEPAGDPVVGRREVHFDGWEETTVYDRRAIPSGQSIEGPAVVEGGESTLVCPPAWTLLVDDRGAVHLRRSTEDGQDDDRQGGEDA